MTKWEYHLEDINDQRSTIARYRANPIEIIVLKETIASRTPMVKVEAKYKDKKISDLDESQLTIIEEQLAEIVEKSIDHRLKMLGQAGWELISADPVASQTGNFWRCVFKRPIE